MNECGCMDPVVFGHLWPCELAGPAQSPKVPAAPDGIYDYPCPERPAPPDTSRWVPWSTGARGEPSSSLRTR